MTTEPVTVHLPHPLYDQLHEQARQMRRSLEEEVLHALGGAVAERERASRDLGAAVARLAALADDALWEVAHTSHLSPAAAGYLEELNHKRQREGLSAEEQRVAEALLAEYERAMVIRAEAMALLTDRGRDITPLLERVTR